MDFSQYLPMFRFSKNGSLLFGSSTLPVTVEWVVKTTNGDLNRKEAAELIDYARSNTPTYAPPSKLLPPEERTDPIEFAHEFLKTLSFEVDATGNPFGKDARNIFDRLTLYVEKHNICYPDDPVSHVMSKAAINIALAELADRGLTDLRYKLRYDGHSTFTEARKALELLLSPIVYGKRETTLQGDVLALLQWMVQVKKKMHDLPVDDHIFPIFYGKEQGTGKSRLVKLLCTNVFGRGWVDVAKGEALTDERNTHSYVGCLVLNAEEMAKFDAKTLESVKAMITAEYMSSRILATEKRPRSEVRCSLIGSANRHISTVFRDSGMRRFYQINFPAKSYMRKNVWPKWAEFDFIKLWRMIDETQPMPSIVLYDEWQEHVSTAQEKWTMKTSVHEFLDRNGIAPGETKTQTKTIFEKYNAFCRSMNYTAYSFDFFAREMMDSGFSLEKEHFLTSTVATGQSAGAM